MKAAWDDYASEIRKEVEGNYQIVSLICGIKVEQIKRQDIIKLTPWLGKNYANYQQKSGGGMEGGVFFMVGMVNSIKSG